MPIDYKRYPPNWKEIRAAVLDRAGDACEFCGLSNYITVYSVRYKRKTTGWYRNLCEALGQPMTSETKRNKDGHTVKVPNPKQVKVVLTIAHLDHDEENHAVKPDRLAALCQLCHLQYDAEEKRKRRLEK